MSIHLRWQNAKGELLRGIDNTTQQWTDRDLALGIAYPNSVTATQEILLRSSASLQASDEVLANIRLYLTGDPEVVEMLQQQWPAAGGGLDISFDDGANWFRFQQLGADPFDPDDPTRRADWVGVEGQPQSWVGLLGSAVSAIAPDGQLGSLDTARVLFRLTVPAGAATFNLHRVRLGADFDVL
jgi:hypothetical protein